MKIPDQEIITSLILLRKQWNLDITNLYITTLSPWLTNDLFYPAIVKYMKKNLDLTKPRYSQQNFFCQSVSTSLYRGSTVL